MKVFAKHNIYNLTRASFVPETPNLIVIGPWHVIEDVGENSGLFYCIPPAGFA